MCCDYWNHKQEPVDVDWFVVIVSVVVGGLVIALACI
jgi:hypothetical protein